MAALLYIAAVVLVFRGPLVSLASHAALSDLHSYILLIPFVSVYLGYNRRRQLPKETAGSPLIGGSLLGLGLITLVLSWTLPAARSLGLNDLIALQTVAFLACVFAGGFFFLGRAGMRVLAFPAAFLAFMIPMPDQVVNALETGYKLASADAAAVLFGLSGVPVFREGQVFQLPGITLEVAQECSGIRSSWVLLIAATVGANLFLKTGWLRAAVMAFVIPLGIVRNGFRILVLGLLCVRLDPSWIDSPIHKQGGPLFFALSLIPLALLLWCLRAWERRATRSESAASLVSGE